MKNGSEDVDFTLVTRKHKLCASSRKGSTKSNIPIDFFAPNVNFDPESISSELVAKISDSVFVKTFTNTFLDVLDQKGLLSSKLDVFVYGLGHLNSAAPRYQLAFALYLRDRLPPSLRTRFFAFDPVFSATEKNILTKYGVRVLEENDEGLRRVTTTTLFFLPHCPHPLCNNVLYANWNSECLRPLFIVGNSFSDFKDMMISRSVSFKYLNAASEFCTEVKLGTSRSDKELENAFSSTSLHYFGDDLVLPFSRDHSKPVYEQVDDFELLR